MVTKYEEMQIVLTRDFEVNSFVKGYWEYKSIWTLKMGQILSIEREQGNEVDKYNVFVKKNNEIVGHLPLWEAENFAKAMSYFWEQTNTVMFRYDFSPISHSIPTLSLSSLCLFSLFSLSSFSLLSQFSLVSLFSLFSLFSFSSRHFEINCKKEMAT